MYTYYGVKKNELININVWALFPILLGPMSPNIAFKVCETSNLGTCKF